LADATTWPAPTATLGCHDDQYGTVTVQAWAGLHPWTCPGLPYASYLLGSLLLAVVFSRASYSIGLR
jgi:hypothetical protein